MTKLSLIDYGAFPPRMLVEAHNKGLIENLSIECVNTAPNLHLSITAAVPCEYVATFDVTPEFAMRAITRELEEKKTQKTKRQK